MSEVITTFRKEPGHDVCLDDLMLAKRTSDVLQRHYPGHLWAVHVNSEGGVMIIKNYSISFLYGMVLHLKNVYVDPSLRSVVRQAGELLERAHMKRGKYQGGVAQVLEGAKRQPKQIQGRSIIV